MNASAKPPTVSAVLTVYNKAPFLPNTIRSLRRQMDDEHDVEYIFVDDASTDDSVPVIKDHVADAPHIRIIENERNRGPSIRLNQGAAAAAGDYLYFLDGDFEQENDESASNSAENEQINQARKNHHENFVKKYFIRCLVQKSCYSYG